MKEPKQWKDMPLREFVEDVVREAHSALLINGSKGMRRVIWEAIVNTDQFPLKDRPQE